MEAVREAAVAAARRLGAEHESERARKIAWLKFLYFWQAVGPSSWGRFASLYYDSVGLSPSQIGAITGSMPMVRALAMPCWGWVADVWSTKKRVALCTQVVAVALLLLLLVPGLATTGGRGRFAQVWAISVASACFASSGVLDAYALDALGPTEKSRFGEIRLWSAVSWGACNLAMGAVADVTGDFAVNIFVFFGCTLVSALILGVAIPDQPRTKTAPTSPRPTPPELPRTSEEDVVTSDDESEDARDPDVAIAVGEFEAVSARLARRVAVAVFFVELFVIGAGMGLVERLLFVYIREVLDGSYTLCGLTVLTTVSLEIPIFANSKNILATLGHEVCFLVALAFYVPRVVGYTLLTHRTKEWIVLVEIAHGVTFGLMFQAAVDKAADLAPPGREATFQTIQNAVRGCFGAGVGASLGGYYWQQVCAHRGKHRDSCRAGAVRLFRVAGAVFAVVLLLHLAGLLALRCCRACQACLAPSTRGGPTDTNQHLRQPLLLVASENVGGESQSRRSSPPPGRGPRDDQDLEDE